MSSHLPRAPRLVGLLAAGCATAIVAGTFSAAQGDPSNDPLEEPVPVPEYIDNAQSFVAAADFTAADNRDQVGVVVANVATPGTRHLRAEVTVRSEVDGQVLRLATMPNPSMSFADHVGFFFQSGRYDVLAPFDAEVETIRLTIAAGVEIVAIDTTPAVRDYCIGHPDDPNCLEADLSIDSVQPSGPLFAVLGLPTTVTVVTTLANNGPDGPVDASLSRSAYGPAGLAVSPDTPHTTVEAGIAVGESRPIGDAYTVNCLTPCTHTLTLTTSITPRRAGGVDANPANDSRAAQLPIDSAVPITINIQPGSTVNPVNLNGSTLPIAALSTHAREYGNPLAFDATTIAR